MTCARTCILLTLLPLLQAIAPPPATPDSLVRDVGRLAAADSNDARFDALVAMLRARGIPFAVEPFTLEKPVRTEPRLDGRNIVVTLGESDEEIVIGAHYDAARLPDGSLSRGAVDNASSSVILVRLAEALHGATLSRRVRIVWFDMEELGLIGSARYLEAHASDRIAAMLNFDINAYGDTMLYGPSGRENSAWLRRAVQETCGAQDLPCVAFPELPPGDDRSFLRRGIPTLSFAILPAVEAHQLWLMVNAGPASGLAPGTAPAIVRTIHTSDDTLARVSGESMARVLGFAVGLVRALDDRPWPGR